VQKDIDRLVSLARIVRRAFEMYAEGALPGGANVGFHRFASDLCGLCYDSSLTLMRLAKRQGIGGVRIGECREQYHWFVLLDDMVVDMTSTQFDRSERVDVLPLEQAERIGCWWALGARLDKPKFPESEHSRIGLAIAEELLKQEGNGDKP